MASLCPVEALASGVLEKSAFTSVQQRMSTHLAELSQFPPLLRQSAEQNWSVSNSFIGQPGESASEILTQEKRGVAELEEMLIKNIESLITLAFLRVSDKQRLANHLSYKSRKNLFGNPTNSTRPRDTRVESIARFCSKSFPNRKNLIAT